MLDKKTTTNLVTSRRTEVGDFKPQKPYRHVHLSKPATIIAAFVTLCQSAIDLIFPPGVTSWIHELYILQWFLLFIETLGTSRLFSDT